jgi:hypothetical protein
MVQVHAPELYEPRQAYITPARKQYLLANRGVDPAMLAEDLGISEARVRLIQRKLRLRKCLNQKDKGGEL